MNNNQKRTKLKAHEEDMTYGHKISVNKKNEFKKQLGETQRRHENNTTMDERQTEYEVCQDLSGT